MQHSVGHKCLHWQGQRDRTVVPTVEYAHAQTYQENGDIAEAIKVSARRLGASPGELTLVVP